LVATESRDHWRGSSALCGRSPLICPGRDRFDGDLPFLRTSPPGQALVTIPSRQPVHPRVKGIRLAQPASCRLPAARQIDTCQPQFGRCCQIWALSWPAKRIRRSIITDCFSGYSSHKIGLAHFLICHIHGFTNGRKKPAEHKRPAQPCNADRVQTAKTVFGGLRIPLFAAVALEIRRLKTTGAPAKRIMDRPHATSSCSHTRRASRVYREVPFFLQASNMVYDASAAPGVTP